MAWFTAIVSIVAALATLAAVWLAGNTVTIAKEAREADERDRHRRQLRAIGQLVEAARVSAIRDPSAREARSAEQAQLTQELIGVNVPLPACEAIASAASNSEGRQFSDAARQEVQAALLRESAPALVRARRRWSLPGSG